MKTIKTILLSAALVALNFTTFAQVGIGITSPDDSAILHLESSDKGFLMPRMTTTEIGDISTPALGLMVYNETENCIQTNQTDGTSDWSDCLGASSNPFDTILGQIGLEANTSAPSIVTIAQLGQIVPALTGIVAANEVAYQTYIDANPSKFDIPATQQQVQDMLNKVNTRETAGPTAQIHIGFGETLTFLQHNVGANNALDPHTPVAAIFGDYYQWGRNAVVATATTSAGAIGSWNTSTTSPTSWDDASRTATDPCPAGFKVPTQEQWQLVDLNNPQVSIGSFTNSPSNYSAARQFGRGDNLLTLPLTGIRRSNDGSLGFRGGTSYYWSSTSVTVTNSNAFNVTSTNAQADDANAKRFGFNVRCVEI